MSVEVWFPKAQQPRPGRLTVGDPIDLATAQDVWNLLRRHDGPGWACTTGRVVRLSSIAATSETPIAVEITPGPDRSVHVRQHGSGWLAWILDDMMGVGDDLAFDQSFLSTEHPARLKYRTWWRLEDSGEGVAVWRPYASRFLGWED